VPLVLFVHGGPWSRDFYRYNGTHQWLANRGYAVLSVNFRGSTGFGKRFISAGDREWGARMQDDLHDAVAWAVRNRVAVPDKVALFGGSYGGYATLAGLAFTPEAFACGVDVFGPSNLQTLLASLPSSWGWRRIQFYNRVGDPATPAGRAMLTARSPLFSAHKIRRPLLVVQPANDPRVKKAESDQIVNALRRRNVPVTYAIFPNEGHGLTRPENNIAFSAIVEQFLSNCLGGQAEPIGRSLEASSLEAPVGADLIPGLAAALVARGEPAQQRNSSSGKADAR
jgi:dipeptidyl aminopeptidase/acylaminoacyl peptidase